jgi:hypothetical protein
MPSSRDHCALRAPTVFLVRMKSASAPKNTVMDKSKSGFWMVLIQDRRLRADGFSSVRNR